MKVAAVIATDGDTVVPLVQGAQIRIRDTESKTEVVVENPALHIANHRRAAVIKELLEQGVGAVITPPDSFCGHSYAVAKSQSLLFWRVAGGSSWNELWNGNVPLESVLSRELPEEDLACHHHHH